MKKQQRIDEQEVRDLITGAGPRAAPPAEEVAKIKRAARAEWREMVERERRRRRSSRLRGGLALAAGVILAVAVGWWFVGRPAPSGGPVVASVELVTGSARTGDRDSLAVGGEIRAGSTVETGAGADGSPAGTALRLAGGQSLRLAADTRVRLLSDSRFELERGALYVDSDASAAAAGVEVLTALGTVRDIGTQFEVRLIDGAAALRVRVREGACEVETAGERRSVTRGEQLIRDARGEMKPAFVQPYGPEWDWVVATAPNIQIDGRSLAEVLGRVEREMGREIRYADTDLQAFAEEAIVGGPTEGVSPTGILETVLLTNRLRHQVENGTILISR